MRTRTPALLAAVFVVSLVAAALPGPGVGPVAAAPAVQWRELRVPSRSGHAMVWDSRRDHALMLGGDSPNGVAHASVWKLVQGAEPRWEPVAVSGAGPLRREGFAALYDSLGDRVLVFGGRLDWGDPGSNELWALSLGGQPTWTLLDASAGALPSARSFASLVLDAQYRLVMFGGEGSSFTPSTPADSSVWLLPLAEAPLAWQQVPLPGTGPGPRARHGAVYSPGTNRMTVFGGDRVIRRQLGVFDYVNCPAKTWELVLDAPLAWVQRASAPGDSVPVPSSGGAFVADRAGEAAWWFPGDQGFDPPDASVWRLNLLASTWTRTQSGAGGPGIRAVAAAAVVPATGEVLVHGGAHFLLSGDPGSNSTETWRFHATDAQPWATAVPIPPPEPIDLNPPSEPAADATRMNWDPLTRRLITWSASGVWTNDVALDGAWKLDAQGAVNAPPPYADPVHVIDSARRRLLVLGGLDASKHSVPPTQLWSWPLDGPSAWTTEAIVGPAPLGTWGIQSAYDPVRDRVIVLPSTNQGEGWSLGNVSVLELSESPPRWVSLPASGGPPLARRNGAVAWDEAGDRLILVGGVNPDLSGSHVKDVWTLSLSGAFQWTNTIPNQLTGPLGTAHGVLLDPTLDRLLVLGGSSQSPMDYGERNTVLSSPLDLLSSWTDLDPDDTSPMFGGGVAMYDEAAERALFWNGTLWEVTWAHGSVDVPPGGPAPPGLALAAPRPNPATGSVTLDLVSGAETDVTLEVFDTAGRRVGSALRRHVTPGRTSFTLPLPRGIAPGVYLVRAHDGTHTTLTRLAVTR